jgi:succinate dehydrogenase / fumarate reductase flavoprotein subunit
MDIIAHDIIIMGSGIAGLRAAIEISRLKNGKLDIALVSKVHVMRSHSVAAEGGTAAAFGFEDSFELHGWDTVKGSDFLADQDAVDRFVRMVPEEILQLEHWGVPWSRKLDGKLDQRYFGGHTVPRTVFAADKTGFFEMSALYDTLQKYDNIIFYNQWFITSLIVEDNKFRGFTAIDTKTGNFHVFKAKAGIIASGGAGRIYGFTTYSHTTTGDGLAIGCRVGLPLKDMEFMQFHPTGIIPSGILLSEAARGEGGYMVNNKNERFMKKYAPEKMELAPRDIVARSILLEIQRGNGVKDPRGLDYVYLDLRHLGADKIDEKLPLIRELAIKFVGRDPIEEPIPIRPVQHYTMGGVHVDINGATPVKGLWVAGEAACVSIHGANRLGTNSTAECLVYGRIVGTEAAKYVEHTKSAAAIFHKEAVAAEEKRIFDKLAREGSENIYDIRTELRETMDTHMGIFRVEDELIEAVNKIKELKWKFRNIRITDKSKVYNTDLISALELENMLDVAEVIALSALTRKESRGAHYRLDYRNRDDKNWLKHTLAYQTPEGIKLEYAPVRITKWQPGERKY